MTPLPASSSDRPMPPVGHFRLIIFDCDGTLVDSQHNIVSAMQGAFGRFGRALPSPEAVRRQVGLTLEIAIARLLPGENEATVAEIAEEYRVIVRALRAGAGLTEPLYDGIRDLILALDHPDIFLGVATGKNLVGLEHTLALHGLRECFHTLQTADLALSKPHPDMVQRAMAETACQAPETVMIGDTSFDMEMARAAGATAIGVGWGYHQAEELRAAGAHEVLAAPGDLIACLQTLSSSR
ncbi:HAD-IA family hydrolase [Dongia sp.]|uniref:HAD-IA family hydrolase n=1 Tax=Dongia sp. TaxID=1977262 RepID=UPI0035B38A26